MRAHLCVNMYFMYMYAYFNNNDVVKIMKFCFFTGTTEIVFVNFYAEWCRFSQLLNPVFEEASKKLIEDVPVSDVQYHRCMNTTSICTRKYEKLSIDDHVNFKTIWLF